MSKIHEQLKSRRKALGLTQGDMAERVGMTRQQYQYLESKGNPRLDTLGLVAKGLKMDLMLIPQEKRRDIEDLLSGKRQMGSGLQLTIEGATLPYDRPDDDPWSDLLEADDD